MNEDATWHRHAIKNGFFCVGIPGIKGGENKEEKKRYDPLATIERHKKRLAKAFEEISNFKDLEPAEQFLWLGHIKTLCVFCAEDMIRAQMIISEE